MALDKIKNFFGVDEDPEVAVKGDNEYYKEDTTIPTTNGSNKMILLEPRAFSESQQIADYLKGRNAVVVKLQRVTPDQAKRIVDFLSGCLYAIGGDLQKLGGGIFLCTPNNINIEGKMSDEQGTSKTKGKTKEEEEFNW